MYNLGMKCIVLLFVALCAFTRTVNAASAAPSPWVPFIESNLSTNSLIVAAICNLAQAHFIHGDPNLALQVAKPIHVWLRRKQESQYVGRKILQLSNANQMNHRSREMLSNLIAKEIKKPRELSSSPKRQLICEHLSSIQNKEDLSQQHVRLTSDLLQSCDSESITATLKTLLPQATSLATKTSLTNLIDTDWEKCTLNSLAPWHAQELASGANTPEELIDSWTYLTQVNESHQLGLDFGPAVDFHLERLKHLPKIK